MGDERLARFAAGPDADRRPTDSCNLLGLPRRHLCTQTQVRFGRREWILPSTVILECPTRQIVPNHPSVLSGA